MAPPWPCCSGHGTGPRRDGDRGRARPTLPHPCHAARGMGRHGPRPRPFPCHAARGMEAGPGHAARPGQRPPQPCRPALAMLLGAWGPARAWPRPSSGASLAPGAQPRQGGGPCQSCLPDPLPRTHRIGTESRILVGGARGPGGDDRSRDLLAAALRPVHNRRGGRHGAWHGAGLARPPRETRGRHERPGPGAAMPQRHRGTVERRPDGPVMPDAHRSTGATVGSCRCGMSGRARRSEHDAPA